MSCSPDCGAIRLLLVLTVVCVAFSANANLAKPAAKWLEEDVRWIITPQERATFEKLTTDEQRDQFIVAFWERRNPAPGSAENKFKVEHYRRIAYSNAHFAFTSSKKSEPGWKTDRGRIYIVYGPPDSIDSHPSSGYKLASGAKATIDAYEVWSYRMIQGFGRDVTVRLVDQCHCGDYRQMTEGGDGNQLPAPSDQ